MRPDCQLSRFLSTAAGGRGRDRRGAVTLWTVLSLPALLLVLFLVADSIHLWVARVELENSMEAAALAAVKHWGDAGGGATLTPRLVGIDYAAANTINGQPVVITDNSGSHPNQNGLCSGNLIFGAVERTTGDPCLRYKFDATSPASCASGAVLIDASGQGGLRTANLNEWGIAFHRDANTPAGLRIASVVIDLGSDNAAYFNSLDFGLSPNTSNKVSCPSSSVSQSDIWGFSSPSNQIQAVFSGASPVGCPQRYKVLTFSFSSFGTDDGFAPCDRFRFGVSVVQGCTSNNYDGDDMSALGATVTINFNTGPSATSTFIHNTVSSNNCHCAASPWDPYCPNSLTVNPTPISDLPCPPSSSASNSGQSYALTSGGGGRGLGVRAQATVSVTSLLCRFCGNVFGPYSISACATAMYDCGERRPRLIRVEAGDYTCPWY